MNSARAVNHTHLIWLTNPTKLNRHTVWQDSLLANVEVWGWGLLRMEEEGLKIILQDPVRYQKGLTRVIQQGRVRVI